MRLESLKICIIGTCLAANTGVAQAPWRVDATPITRVAGTAGTTVHFARPTGATRLSNGSIVVGDATGGSLAAFAQNGTHITNIGRRGNGPGEFRFISWLGQCGRDSVFVWDITRDRITVVTPDLIIARQYSIPVSPGAPPAPAILACSRTGTFATLSRPAVRMVDNKKTGSLAAPLSVRDAQGAVTRIVGDVNVYEYGVDPGGNIVPRPLGKITSLALSDDQIVVGTADSAAVHIYSLDGRRLRTLSVPITRRKPTQAHYDRAGDALVKFGPDAETRSRMKRQFLAMPMPEFMPAYSGILVDPAGILWAVVSHAGDPDTRLIAFDRSGQRVADLRIPPALAVYEIGTDYILVGGEDAGGEPYIAAYRLRRG